MMKNAKRNLEIVLAFIAVLALVGSGYWLGLRSASTAAREGAGPAVGLSNALPPASTTADFKTFWEAWQTIDQSYLNIQSSTDQKKVQGAIDGLVASLGDPYSEYFTPELNRQFKENISGNFGGIGAQLGVATSGNIVIVAPLKGTPAEAAGLKAGDRVIAIDATSTRGMSVDDAVTRIRGPQGTPVTLSILREGWDKPKDFKIVRAVIQVPNVEFKMEGQFAHITLNEFTEDANLLFYQALVRALAANAKGIVLDLRDDPGGYLEVAVNISGYFLKPGSIVVKEVGRTVPEETFRAPGDGALSEFPMVILINKGSASASEILAGALRDNRKIKLVGETSFASRATREVSGLDYDMRKLRCPAVVIKPL